MRFEHRLNWLWVGRSHSRIITVQRPKLKDLFLNHSHWPDVERIVKKLDSHGFVAYLAGGAIRDALLGREAHDFDIATDAHPEEIEKLFKNAIGVGRQFGVMMLPFGDFQIEVATFRRDGEYGDGRHPTEIHYSSAEEDSRRRDFTVNALFYDPLKDEIIDFVDGLKDLKVHTLRAVGDPLARFNEDKLRILRAARLSTQLDFAIDPKTLQAMKQCAPLITVVSRERITDELFKMAGSKNLRHGIEVLLEVGLFKAIWPKLSFQNDSRLLAAFMASVSQASGSFEMLLALLEIFNRQHLTKQPEVAAVSEAVRAPLILSRDQQRRIDFLVHGREHLARNEFQGLLDLNHNDGPLLTEMCLALTSAGLFEKGAVGNWITRFLDIADDNGALPKPLVVGDDLLRLGFKASPRMGEVLNELFMNQINNKIKNRDELLAMAERLKVL